MCSEKKREKKVLVWSNHQRPCNNWKFVKDYRIADDKSVYIKIKIKMTCISKEQVRKDSMCHNLILMCVHYSVSKYYSMSSISTREILDNQHKH